VSHLLRLLGDPPSRNLPGFFPSFPRACFIKHSIEQAEQPGILSRVTSCLNDVQPHIAHRASVATCFALAVRKTAWSFPTLPQVQVLGCQDPQETEPISPTARQANNRKTTVGTSLSQHRR